MQGMESCEKCGGRFARRVLACAEQLAGQNRMDRRQLGEHRVGPDALSLHRKDPIERHPAIEKRGDFVRRTGLFDLGKFAGERRRGRLRSVDPACKALCGLALTEFESKLFVGLLRQHAIAIRQQGPESQSHALAQLNNAQHPTLDSTRSIRPSATRRAH